MTTLQSWIIHRAKMVRLAWPDGVADAAGVAPGTLDSISVAGNLRQVGRGTRGYLARALKVSVRELEALESGRLKWIEDERRVQFDRLSLPTTRPDETLVPQAYVCPTGQGVPILGKVLSSGKVEHFDNWTPEEGPRLPVRFAGVPDGFALELALSFGPHLEGDSLVFQMIPPGEIRDGELILLSHSDGEGVTELCVASRSDDVVSFRATSIAESCHARLFEFGDILRAARVVGDWKRSS